MTTLNSTTKRLRAPWVSRSKEVPETKDIAAKLLMLAQVADLCDAPTWSSPSSRKEVAEKYRAIAPLLAEVTQLMNQVVATA